MVQLLRTQDRQQQQDMKIMFLLLKPPHRSIRQIIIITANMKRD
jgi:hypothetical protein